MRVERTVDSKVKESLWPTTPAQSGCHIPLVFMPEDPVHRTMARMMDACICVDSRRCIIEENDSEISFPEGGVFKPAHRYCQEGK